MKVEENMQNMRVVVRVRPFSNSELERNQHNIIKIEDSKTLIFDPDSDDDEFFYHGVKQTHRDITKRSKKKILMEFDNVYDLESTNLSIFEQNMKPLIRSVMNGFNCSVFVYGATGAGKTFTMLGNNEFPGITYLTMRELFDQIDALVNERKFDIGITYLEVYNEQVMNLLTKTGPLKLREDIHGVAVCGLGLKTIYNADELLELLAAGNKNRTQHPTDANAESSRSHAIFQVHIRMTDKKFGQKKTVKLSMIDLAGSERAASTKCTGKRFQEGASINKSLLALGNCINKLADGMKHIPYRDSNLTRILKDSLGGNCQTVMIANISPSSLTYEDTYKTLTYASRAKKIRTALKQNIVKSNMPKEYYVKKVIDLQTENERLQEVIKKLENKLNAEEPIINSTLTNQQQSNGTDNITSNKLNDNNTLMKPPPPPPPLQKHKSGSLPLNVAFDKLTNWHKTIDETYLNYIKSIENIFKLQSKIRILRFRTQMKDNLENLKCGLPLDGDSKLNNDTARRETTVDRIGKQMRQLQDNMVRYVEKMNNSNVKLEKLKETIESCGLTAYLNPYLIGKDHEIESVKNNIRSLHTLSINSIYFAEEEKLRKKLHLSNEIIQHDYMLLKANKLIDSTMLANYNSLKKLHQGHFDVKFADEHKALVDDGIFDLNFDNNLNSIGEKCNLTNSNSNYNNNSTTLAYTTTSQFKRPISLVINEEMNIDVDNTYINNKNTHYNDSPSKLFKTNNSEQLLFEKQFVLLEPPTPSPPKSSSTIQKSASSTSAFNPRQLLPNLNETHVIHNVELVNIDQQHRQQPSLINNYILGNHNEKVKASKAIKTSIKPNSMVLHKVINKENKRLVTPIRKQSPKIRYSPRMAKAFSSAAQLLSRKRIKSATSSSESTPQQQQQPSLPIRKFNNITKKY